MDIPSNKSTPAKSWQDLVTRARKVAPPGDIDVRFAVRAAIESEGRARSSEEAGLFAELHALSRRPWFCGLLGGGVLALVPLLMAAADVYRDLIDFVHFAGPMGIGL